jgi:hypothetical protein
VKKGIKTRRSEEKKILEIKRIVSHKDKKQDNNEVI